MWRVIQVNSGDMDQRLFFKIPVGGKDDDGFPINKPVEYTKAWGSLKTLKGNTFYAAAQSNREHNREFTIRYQRKLLDSERPHNLVAFWREQEHEIESIEDDNGLRKTMTARLKAIT